MKSQYECDYCLYVTTTPFPQGMMFRYYYHLINQIIGMVIEKLDDGKVSIYSERMVATFWNIEEVTAFLKWTYNELVIADFSCQQVKDNFQNFFNGLFPERHYRSIHKVARPKVYDNDNAPDLDYEEIMSRNCNNFIDYRRNALKRLPESLHGFSIFTDIPIFLKRKILNFPVLFQLLRNKNYDFKSSDLYKYLCDYKHKL